MNIETLVRYLDRPADATAWLRTLGLNDTARGHANLVQLARTGVTLDLLAGMCGQLEDCLPGLSDPDMALNNLERFLSAARSPLSLASLFERDAGALATLLNSNTFASEVVAVLMA